MKLLTFVLAALVCLNGCSEPRRQSTTTVAAGDQAQDPDVNPVAGPQPNIQSKPESGPSSEVHLAVGTVARVKLDDRERETELNNRLHFCVFENGENDTIYVGTRFGLWSKGEFDLEIGGKKVFTGRVPHLVYQGVLVNMGNVVDEQPKSNVGVYITRVTGWFK